uniref:NBS-LRR resistance protein n=1 Tax=Solanum tuberosum TaxID=4113 RepID=M1DTD1_SOLTU
MLSKNLIKIFVLVLYIGLAYEAEHAIDSIPVRDHGLLQLMFFLPDTIEKIKLIKEEVPTRISKSKGLIVGNAPSKPVEIKKSSTMGQIIVGFEDETEWIIRKLTSGPTEVDVISIVRMPGLGKTTLAYRVFNDKSVVEIISTSVLGAQSTKSIMRKSSCKRFSIKLLV